MQIYDRKTYNIYVNLLYIDNIIYGCITFAVLLEVTNPECSSCDQDYIKVILAAFGGFLLALPLAILAYCFREKQFKRYSFAVNFTYGNLYFYINFHRLKQNKVIRFG